MELRVDPEAGLVEEVIHQQFEGNPSTPLLISNLYVTDGANRTVERWFGNTTVSRTEFENGSVEYRAFEEGMWTPDTRIEQVSSRLLTSLQNAGETTTASMVDAEDGIYYVIEAGDNISEDEMGSNQPEHEIEARTLVREDGLIRQTVVGQVTVVENEDRTVINQTTEIADIGETSVERPD